MLGRVYLDGIVNRKISALAGGPLSRKKPEFLKVVEHRVRKHHLIKVWDTQCVESFLKKQTCLFFEDLVKTDPAA